MRVAAALTLALSLIGAEVVSTPVPRAASKTVVIFGDSQSDNCNVWRSQGGSSAAAQYPWPSCPSPPTGRAMAAPVWGERLKSQNPSWGVQIFAQRGSVADNNHFTTTSNPPDLAAQVRLYFTQYGSRSYQAKIITPAASTWAVTQLAGGNDIESAITKGRGTVANDISALRTQYQLLMNAGFRNFVQFDMYDYSTNPHWRSSSRKSDVVTYVNNYNSQLKTLVNQLNSRGQGTVKIFPFSSLVKSIQSNPGQYGIKNTKDECENLSSCSGYLWYDDRHFATDIEPIIAQRVASYTS